MEIGKQIKSLRQKRCITQEEMSQRFGVTPQAISKWERGVTTPDISLLPDISAYFGVTIDDIMKKRKNMQKKPLAENLVCATPILNLT